MMKRNYKVNRQLARDRMQIGKTKTENYQIGCQQIKDQLRDHCYLKISLVILAWILET